jgi:nitrate reductase alpha subunit
VKLKLSLMESNTDGSAQAHQVAEVAFPYFGGMVNPHFKSNAQGGAIRRVKVPVTRLGAGGPLVATVFDLQVGQYGVERGLGDGAKSFDDNAPYTPGLAGEHHRRAARAGHHGGAPVRRERREDPRQVDGDHRRGDEPLVPQPT